MSETPTVATELTSQYSTQVADDLERNLKEQARLTGEIDALQAQLAALRHDNTVLVSIQQALGVPTPPTAEPVAAVPAPRKKRTPAAKAPAKRKQAEKAAAPARKRAGKKATTGKKAAARTPAASAAPSPSTTAPTLVDLVREHLAGQNEPRSAAEISTALGQQHPERTVKTTVVRTTLEGLVAKAQAQRTKQGTSVFYTAPESAGATSSGESADEPSA
ncbi:hypothetical protein ACIRPX_39830 [Streptomyces sp. NPDC101225]|uniref:hypothetical protein n=1 Tax=Streptomyces sp. NPDC101225 TaxID=3366135 RepID=UPI0037FDA892